MMSTALIIVAAYLWGAVPSAYLVGRYLKGIDIRDYGSGNVGGSNMAAHVGKWQGFLILVFDSVGKGTVPVVAAMLMNKDLAVEAGVGAAVIAGHNWSPYIRFTGGRGVATAIGVLAGFSMWWELVAWALLIGVAGRILTRDVAFWTLVAVLALPVLTLVFERPPEIEITLMSVAIALLLVLKRLLANWESPLNEYSLPRVLAYRLLWDRDVPRRQQWEARAPTSGDTQ